MAKHNDDTPRPNPGTRASDASGAAADNALEQRMLAFAEQLGRIAGAVHGKAKGWMDREALATQVASVRDAAADLLEHLADAARTPSKRAPAAGAARGTSQGRSGGVVDAPGKKHRKPPPSDPAANKAASQAAKMRAAKTMVKTNRLRGRG